MSEEEKLQESFRKKAEEHWNFLEKILRANYILNDVPHFDKETVHYLYVESMVHGFKHGKESK